MLSMEEVYQRHARTVCRYLLSQTHDMSLAEELTQETFYQAIRSVDKFDRSCAVSTWLCAIAKNVLRTYRRKHPEQEEWSEASINLPSPEDDVIAKECRLDLLHNLQKLDDRTREIMYLRLYADLSFRDIGEILSITEHYARVMFYRGKEKLRKELTDNDK